MLWGSCASTVHQHLSQRALCASHIADAIKRYNAGKFSSAKNIFDDVKEKCGGSEIMDTAQYYLAMSLMQMKFYPEAKLEFSRLTQDFPRSPFLDEARFRIGYCVLKSSRSVDRDQAEIAEAQRLFQDFLESYPSSPFADSAAKYLKATVERLAEKEFNSAKFYQKLGEKEAALIYYKAFIQDYPASELVVQARLNMSQLLIELNRKAEAREVLDELTAQENTPRSPQRPGSCLPVAKSDNPGKFVRPSSPRGRDGADSGFWAEHSTRSITVISQSPPSPLIVSDYPGCSLFPTGRPPHKPLPGASALHRVAMLRLAVAGEPSFEVREEDGAADRLLIYF